MGLFSRKIPWLKREKTITGDDMLYVHLKDPANGNSKDMHANGSITPKNFEYVCPSNKYVFIHRVNFLMIDGTISPGNFGGLAALTNGLTCKLFEADGTTVVIDFLEGHLIKKTAEFSHLAGDSAHIDSSGASDDSFHAMWDMHESNGYPLLMKPGQIFRMTVSDDLTGLTSFHTILNGLIVSTF